ncbi:MAG: hypothetical protein Q8K98_12555 [Bacteroidota bacterium]|nr:hypothetical protein [Bacteroidota bacterium]
MRNLIHLFIALVIIISIIGCSSSSKMEKSCEVPEWYNNVPQDPNYLFAPNTATSKDLQLSVDKATQAARTEIGRQQEIKINGLQKRFNEETGFMQDAQLLDMYTQASKTVVSTVLSGSRAKYQEQCKEGEIWRAWILVEYHVGAANQAFLEQIRKNEQMYTRFRATQTFKELDDEVQKYEDWKKQQGQ